MIDMGQSLVFKVTSKCLVRSRVLVTYSLIRYLWIKLIILPFSYCFLFNCLAATCILDDVYNMRSLAYFAEYFMKFFLQISWTNKACFWHCAMLL